MTPDFRTWKLPAGSGWPCPRSPSWRNVIERRLFRTDQYRKLFRLGGGKRYRADEFADPEETFGVRPEALLLRQALTFDPKAVARWLDAGFWSAETVVDRMDQLAEEAPEATLIADGAGAVSRQEIADRAHAAAAALAALGLRRGDVVALVDGKGRAGIICLLGIVSLGAAAMLLPPGCARDDRLDLLHRARVRAIVDGNPAEHLTNLRTRVPSLEHVIDPADLSAHAPSNHRLRGPVAADPLTLVSSRRDDRWVLVPQSHQTGSPRHGLVSGQTSPASLLTPGFGMPSPRVPSSN